MTHGLCFFSDFDMRYRQLLALTLFSIVSCIQAAALEVRRIEINEVGFDGSEKWMEYVIEIEVLRDSKDALRREPDFIDDLQVDFLVGIDSRESGGGFEFYTSRALLVSLERGKHFVRFYLPPEVLERDEVEGEPYAYLIRLTRDGTNFVEMASDSLERSQVRKSFLGRIAKESARNRGILRPQNKSPFDKSYARSTPSYKADSDDGGAGSAVVVE